MFSSLSTLSSSASTSSSSTSSATTKVLGVIQKQNFEEKIPLISKEEVEKNLASTLSQVQQNQIKRLNLTPPSLGRFYELANTLRGHECMICSLAVLKSGGTLASGSGDSTIKLWDLPSLSCLFTLRGYIETAWALAALPNGLLASSSGSDATIKLWDLASDSSLATLQGHTASVLTLAVLPNGLLASGSVDTSIKLWDLVSGSCLSTLKGHTGTVYALAVLPNGLLASGSADKTIKIWSDSGSCLSTLQAHTDAVYALAVLPNGMLASGSFDKAIKLWDMASYSCLSTLQGHTWGVYALAVLPNGLLASGSLDNTIKLWDLASRSCLSTLQGHTSFVWALAALPNGLLVSGSWDTTIKLWEPKTPSSKQLALILNALKNNTSVTDLDLSHNPEIGDDIIDPLIDIFASNITLKTVGLQKTKVTSKAIEKLQKAIHARSLSVTILTELSEQEKRQAQQKAQSEKETMEKAMKEKEAQKLREQKERQEKLDTLRLQLAKEKEDQAKAQEELEEQQKTQEEEAEIQRLQAELQKLKIRKLTRSSSLSINLTTCGFASRPSFYRLGSQGSQPIQTPDASEVKDVKTLYLINYNTLTFDKVLGEGGFGAVYKGTYNEGEVAIKKLLVKKMSAATEEEFKNETSIMAQLKHPNIVTLYGYTLSPSYCIVMELMDCSLYRLLQNNANLPWSTRMSIAKDIVAGLVQLHESGILHRDLKSLNVLLSSNMRAKLADFGLSKVKNEMKANTKSSEGVVGTVQWMAPELFDLKPKYSRASDIYAYAMVLWELATCKIPYSGAHQLVVIAEVRQGKREEIPKDCPPKISSLIKFCWIQEGHKRPKAKEIAAFLRSNDEEFKPAPSAPSAASILSSQIVSNKSSLKS